MLNINRLMGVIAGCGLTQKELAIKIGMSKNSLNSRINNKSRFDTDEIDKICEVLDINSNRDKVFIFLSPSSQNRDIMRSLE